MFKIFSGTCLVNDFVNCGGLRLCGCLWSLLQEAYRCLNKLTCYNKQNLTFVLDSKLIYLWKLKSSGSFWKLTAGLAKKLDYNIYSLGRLHLYTVTVFFFPSKRHEYSHTYCYFHQVTTSNTAVDSQNEPEDFKSCSTWEND